MQNPNDSPVNPDPKAGWTNPQEQQRPWTPPESPFTPPVDPTLDSQSVRSGNVRFAGAMFLIVAGIALFLNNVGLLPIYNIWRFWPVILIAVGIGKAFGNGTSKDRGWGMIELVFGVLFLGSNLHVFALHLNDATWIVGVILVVIGLASLAGMFDPAWNAIRSDKWRMHYAENWKQGYADKRSRRFTCGRAARRGVVPPDAFTSQGNISERLLHEEAVFSSIKRRIISDAFAGGSIQAVFASVELDLRLASIPAGTATIVVNSVFASVELKVPANWRVSARIAGGFGSLEDKTLPLTRTDIGGPMLIITGSNVFGSIEVSN